MDTPVSRAPAALRLLRGGPLLRLRSDDQLLAVFRAGNDEAFQVLHDRYRQRLFVYTRQMLGGSQADAEDAMQDVFLRAYGALRVDDRPVSVRAWLYRVAHNRCIDQLRRPRPTTVELLEETAAGPLHDPAAATQQREDLRRLVTDVGRLPEQQRSALLLREMEGLTYQELAGALDCSVPAVKSLLVRARMGLAEQAEARALSCADIRDDLDQAHDRGVRMTGRARRHLRDCAACRSYRATLKGVATGLHGLAPSPGPWALALKLLGLGGAGSGAAAGGAATMGGAASAGGGIALVGGGAAATAGKVAAIVCCAAVVGGGAAEVQERIVPAQRPAKAQAQKRPARAAATAVPAVAAVIHRLDRSGPRPELARPESREKDRVARHDATQEEALVPAAAPLPLPEAVDPADATPVPEPPISDIAGGLEAPAEPVPDAGTTPVAGSTTTPGTTTPTATTTDPAPTARTEEPARDTGAPMGAQTPAPGAGGTPTSAPTPAGTP